MLITVVKKPKSLSHGAAIPIFATEIFNLTLLTINCVRYI